MEIGFRTKKMKKIANSQKELQSAFGKLADEDTLEIMRSLPHAHCHELKGKRQKQLAVKLNKNNRLTFEPAEKPLPERQNGGLDWSRVTAIRIISLAEDYHGD